MMNEKITSVIEYLASSVENNEVTNVEKLTLAIEELEDFPMTFEILDSSRVGQILQSVRHSKQITIFLIERIRSLIKCWRQLINADIASVVPNEIKSKLSKTPAVKNGYANGYVRESPAVPNDIPINGINHSKKADEDVVAEIETCKSKSPIAEIIPDKEVNNSSVTEFEILPDRSRNISQSSKVDETFAPPNESQTVQPSQIVKPKVKSTKELLADFSNFIENDVKNKILMDKISQEDDEPISYFPKDSRIKELVQLSILQEKTNHRLRTDLNSLRKRKREPSGDSDNVLLGTSKCAVLLKQFNDLCSVQPRPVVQHFVPWPNLKRGLQMHAPEIKQPFSKRRRTDNVSTKPADEPICLDVINDLLESYEVRAQQKQMLTDAVQQRKEQTKVIDNTLSLVDMSLKLKLKIPKVPTIKIRRKKTRKKKKKPKIKPIKIKVKKPRKPYVRPMPPVTNFLDDIPMLPPLPDGGDEDVCELAEVERKVVEYSEENLMKLLHGVFEGYNCTRNGGDSRIYQLTSMYSTIVNEAYLHIFPWVDLQYPTKSSFPDDSNQFLQSILDIDTFAN